MKCSTQDCQACPSLRLCTQSLRHVRRTVTIRPKEQYQALQARRQQESTQVFKTLYATRAGVEGTISLGHTSPPLKPGQHIEVPAGVAIFPKDIGVPPREWGERTLRVQ